VENWGCLVGTPNSTRCRNRVHISMEQSDVVLGKKKKGDGINLEDGAVQIRYGWGTSVLVGDRTKTGRKSEGGSRAFLSVQGGLPEKGMTGGGHDCAGRGARLCRAATERSRAGEMEQEDVLW
jgi:hypothetical protein